MASEGSSTRVIYDISNITSSTKLNVGDIINIPYSGAAKNITLPAGKFKLQCWGAQGGTYSTYTGGAGGYSVGTLTLAEDTILYVYVGGQPTSSSSTSAAIAGGFNGGGQARPHSYSGTSSTCQAGGGGTDFRIKQDSLYARVIVAGGGGGSASDVALTTKYGGGTSGGSSISGYGGTQTSAGTSGSFGQGANGYISGYNYKYASGGAGGGWYGGGAIQQHSDSTNYRSYNGGGSGYVYTSSTASNYPSGCLLNSSYYLTDASTIAGNTSFPSTSGATETGHTGNGYARITVVEIAPTFSLPVRVDDEWKLATSGAVNVGGAWKNIAQVFSKVNGNWIECMGGEPPIEGTWRFYSTIDSVTGATDSFNWIGLAFKSNDVAYTTMSGGTNSADIYQMFYANSSESINHLVYGASANSWMDQAYRTITFTSPVSVSAKPDFATWFKANAIKLVPISGTWKFNSSIADYPISTSIIASSINFTSNNAIYTTISAEFSNPGNTGYGLTALMYDSTTVISAGADWTNQAYRIITFTDTQMVPKDFYQWFIANAEPLILAKGTIIYMDLDGRGDKPYRILEDYIRGGTVQCLAMDDISTSQTYNATSKTGTFTNGATGQLYAGSDLDTYLNTTWYNTLSTTAKAAIVSESRTQYMYKHYDTPDEPNTTTYTYQYQYNWSDSDYDNADLTDSILVGDRNVFVLDLKDIFDYFGKVCITSNELMGMWTNETSKVSRYWWLSSARVVYSDYAWRVFGDYGCLGDGAGVGSAGAVRPAFTMDLSAFPYSTGNGYYLKSSIEPFGENWSYDVKFTCNGVEYNQISFNGNTSMLYFDNELVNSYSETWTLPYKRLIIFQEDIPEGLQTKLAIMATKMS